MRSLFIKIKHSIIQREFAKNVLTLLLGTLGAQLIPLLFSPILTRLYSPDQFGTFALFIALSSSIVTLASMRYELAILLPKSNTHAYYLFYLSIVTILITTGITAIVGSLFQTELGQLLKNTALEPYLGYLFISVFFAGLIQPISYWQLRQKNFTLLSRNKLQQSFLSNILQLLFGCWKTTSSAFGLIVGLIISQIVSIWFLRKKNMYSTIRPTLLQLYVIAKKYKNLPLLNGSNAIIDSIRINGINILIALFFSSSTLGQFALAWRMVQAPISLINGAISQVSFQKASTLKPEKIFYFALSSIKNSALAGIIPFTIIYFYSPSIFPLIFGPKWVLAGEIAQILTPWLYLNLITSPLSTLFIVIEKQLPALIFSIIYAIVPLTIIYLYNSNILQALTYSSHAMTLLLLFYIVMVLYLTKKHSQC